MINIRIKSELIKIRLFVRHKTNLTEWHEWYWLNYVLHTETHLYYLVKFLNKSKFYFYNP